MFHDTGLTINTAAPMSGFYPRYRKPIFQTYTRIGY
jgi:hypothetical protein